MKLMGINVKKLLIIMLPFLLLGCEKRVENSNYTDVLQLNDELKDCKAYFLQSGVGGHMTVIRCPNSSVSTSEQQGKITTRAIVIDGKEYELKEK